MVGPEGNAEWKPNDPAHWGLQPGQTVPFRDGTPDFTKYAHARPDGKPGVFEVPGLTGDQKGDTRKVIKHLADENGWTQREVKAWLAKNRLRVHHFKGNQVQLVPAQLHKLAHQGGAKDLRDGP